jgi:hypothetical protein
MEKLIKKILKEELQGQEFIDNFYEERKRFERTKDEIINYIKSQHPNLIDVEYETKKVILASIRIGMESPSLERMVVIFKFKGVEGKRSGDPIKNDIISIFTNYFGFDVMGYGSPIDLVFKAQAWVNF